MFRRPGLRIVFAYNQYKKKLWTDFLASTAPPDQTFKFLHWEIHFCTGGSIAVVGNQFLYRASVHPPARPSARPLFRPSVRRLFRLFVRLPARSPLLPLVRQFVRPSVRPPARPCVRSSTRPTYQVPMPPETHTLQLRLEVKQHRLLNKPFC